MVIKHIYWFAYFNREEPSVRYRATYPLAHFRGKYKITSSVVYPGYGFRQISTFLLIYLSVLFFRKKNSIIVFQKIYTNRIYAHALKFLLFVRPQHTLYDMDDAEHTRRPAGTINYFIKRCSACSVGSQSLMAYIRQFNQNVFFLTSPVIDHGHTKKELEKTLTIGWVGYYGAHRQSLTTLLFPALAAITFPVKLKLLGVKNEEEAAEIEAYFRHHANVSVDTPLHLNWLDEHSIYEIIKTFDIGVSPLMDNEFNRGKSAFKLKQYLSCGVPVLASSVGENKRFLQDGVNGYLCDKPADYAEKLASIVASQNGHYKTLSHHAKESFPAFSVDNYCTTLLNYFKGPGEIDLLIPRKAGSEAICNPAV